MAQQCSVCYHPEGHAINEAIILEGKSNRAIALRYGVSKDSVQRHKTHIPNLLRQARHDMQVYDASNILAKIETLERETLDPLEAAKGDSDIKHVLAAVREQRGNLELAARIAKLINEAPTINVLNAPQWIEVRSAVVEALQAHPFCPYGGPAGSGRGRGCLAERLAWQGTSGWPSIA